MAAIIVLAPHSDRGVEILDELERRIDQRGERLDDGQRSYTLLGAQAEVDAFDKMLDLIEGHWRQHISRTGQ
jgi:hypothetical protein